MQINTVEKYMADFSDLHKATKSEELMVDALVNFLEVYALEFIGEANINYGAIFNYLKSGYTHWFVAPKIKTLEDAMELIEEWVLDGAPIWNFLHLSNDLQRQVFKELEEAYNEDCKRKDEDQRIANLKIYKCLTCEHYEITLYSGKIVLRKLPDMKVFSRRCKYIEGREEGQNITHAEKAKRQREISRKIRYNPGSFNVYLEENKKGCSGYKYDKRRDC